MQNSLLKPRIIDVEALGAGHAKVVMEPFERGYGHTLGNALRRVLLSSMVGYAPTEVTIAGVVHEYSSLDGVQEDVVDLLLNLKGVVFKVHNRDSVTLTLKKEGEGAILASDIDLPHDVELINPDHVIAHLTAGGKLDMQIKVEKGRGYVPGNVRRLSEDTNKTIGRIILDASFSPVRRVSYFVESARVEQRTEGQGNVEPTGTLRNNPGIDSRPRVFVRIGKSNQGQGSQARGCWLQQLRRDGNIGNHPQPPFAHALQLDGAEVQLIPVENETGEITADEGRQLRRLDVERRSSGRKHKTFFTPPDAIIEPSRCRPNG